MKRGFIGRGIKAGRNAIAGLVLFPIMVSIQPTHAQMAVIDGASVMQQILDYIIQLMSWKAQLDSMTDNVNALTGSNGFGAILDNPALNNIAQIQGDIQVLNKLYKQADNLRAQYGSTYDCSKLKNNEAVQDCTKNLRKQFEELAFIQNRLSGIENKNAGMKQLFGNLAGASDVNSKTEATGAINGQILNTLIESQQQALYQQKAEAERRIAAQKQYEDYQKRIDANQDAINNGAPLWSLNSSK